MSDRTSSNEAATGRGPEAPGAYRTTQWTVIATAAADGGEEARAAFGRLYQDYWAPVHSFICRQGHTPEVAQDLGQSFFLHLLSQRALADLRPELGRFRCFIVAALRNYLANERERARAQKRGGGVPHVEFDGMTAERESLATSSDLIELGFDREWAWTLLRSVMRQLQAEYSAAGKADLLDELRGYLGGVDNRPSHAALARKHGITVNTVGVAIFRLRRRFGELLRQEVFRTVPDPAEVKAEIRHLLAVLEKHPDPMTLANAPDLGRLNP